MQLEYAEKEDSYLRSKEVSENTVLIHFNFALPGTVWKIMPPAGNH